MPDKFLLYRLPVGTNKIKFRAISSYGNNLFLDTICVTSPSTGITQLLSGSVPETYSLSQNYPNPFNPSTKINISIPKQGLVSLKIYDVLGKEIMTLINEQKTAGSYEVDFNGINLASGAYFYRLESSEFVDIKRMILIK